MLSSKRELFFKEQDTSHKMLEVREEKMRIEYRESKLEVLKMEIRVEMRERRMDIAKYALEIMMLGMQQQREDIQVQHRSNQLDLREQAIENQHQSNQLDAREREMRIEQQNNLLQLTTERLKMQKQEQDAYYNVQSKLLEANTKEEQNKIAEKYVQFQAAFNEKKQELMEILYKTKDSELKAKTLNMYTEVDKRNNNLTIGNAMARVQSMEDNMRAAKHYDAARLERMKTELNTQKNQLNIKKAAMENDNGYLRDEMKREKELNEMYSKQSAREMKEMSAQIKYFKTDCSSCWAISFLF